MIMKTTTKAFIPMSSVAVGHQSRSYDYENNNKSRQRSKIQQKNARK